LLCAPPLSHLFPYTTLFRSLRPRRPRVALRARFRRHRHQLELIDRPRALPVHGAEAVGAGIAAADDNHVAILRGDELIVRDFVALAAAVLQREELHREVNALQLAPRNG